VIEKYKENLEQIADRKKLIKDATKIDPTTQPFPEGRLNFVEQGQKQIDYMFT